MMFRISIWDYSRFRAPVMHWAVGSSFSKDVMSVDVLPWSLGQCCNTPCCLLLAADGDYFYSSTVFLLFWLNLYWNGSLALPWMFLLQEETTNRTVSQVCQCYCQTQARGSRLQKCDALQREGKRMGSRGGAQGPWLWWTPIPLLSGTPRDGELVFLFITVEQLELTAQ